MCDQSEDVELGKENLASFNESQNKCMYIILIYFSTWNLQQIMFPELIAIDLITNSLIFRGLGKIIRKCYIIALGSRQCRISLKQCTLVAFRILKYAELLYNSTH